MNIFNNFSLKDKNTFNIEAKAKFFATPHSAEEVKDIFKNQDLMSEQLFVLGGGSNVLFISDYDGLIIYPQMFGKEVFFEDKNSVIVKANASENWDTFVEWTIEKGYGGLENLSLIPGTVGACPVQNIGAYGVEVADIIEKVETIEIPSAKIKSFTNMECKFAYRNSIFKNNLKNKHIVSSVYFRLSKNPVFKTYYGSIEQELNQLGEVSLSAVRQAVVNIRESKLPDPVKIPNAGSFFKNPIISKKHLTIIKEKYPDIVSYPAGNNQYKMAAGWMIDKLGWKGKQMRGAGVHEKQALVLINKQNASGKQILELAMQIQQSVLSTFNVLLEFEVNIIGNLK